MCNRIFFLICLIFLFSIMGGFNLYSQESEAIQATKARWRLSFELLDTPASITVEDPAGDKAVYWYFRYKIVNDTDQIIPWRGDVKIVIDKAREGMPEHKVPGLFSNAEFPEEEEGTYYRLMMETKEDSKNQFWEVLIYRDTENRLVLIKKQQMKDANCEINQPYEELELDSEVKQKVEFIEIDLKTESYEQAEFNKMAEQEVLPLMNPDYTEKNFVKLHRAAKQIGFKIFTRPELYIGRLQTYYDIDLPAVKKEIMEQLPRATREKWENFKVYPRIAPQEKAILEALENKVDNSKQEKKRKSVFETMGNYYLFVLELQKDTESLYWEVILYEDLQDNFTLTKSQKIELAKYKIRDGFAQQYPEKEGMAEKANKAAELLMKEEKLEHKLSKVHRVGILNISYEEAENALISLVEWGLVLPEEVEGTPTFAEATPDGPKFLIRDQDGRDQEVILGNKEKQVNSIAGWELVSYTEDAAIMKKNTPKGDVVTSFYPGASLEYLYVHSDKIFVDGDIYYASGSSARGIYKGRTLENDPPFKFDNILIPPKKEYLFYLFQIDIKYLEDFENGKLPEDVKKMFADKDRLLSKNVKIEVEKEDSEWLIMDERNFYLVTKVENGLNVYQRNNQYAHYGLAIFPDISPEMDFMGIVVSGLVDPVVWRQCYIEKGDSTEIQSRNYIENEVYMIAYARPGDEFSSQYVSLEKLYGKWVLLSRTQVKMETERQDR